MVVELDHVKKNYDSFSLDCSMQIEEGCITGLIGQNGAGKTTVFKTILDLISTDSGEARVFGTSIKDIDGKLKQDIGVVFADSGFSNCFTIRQIIKILEGCYENFHKEQFIRQCKDMNLPMDKNLKDFSTGMKAKLKTLAAISHDAKLLILDEVTAGLDIVARDKILDLLREYMETEGRSILISSHISTDLESLCDDIYMIDEGKIVLHEDTDVLLSEYGLLKLNDKQFETLEKQYLICVKKETFGYSCLTNKRQFYIENYPDIVAEKGNIDEVIMMMIKGERL